MNTCEEIFKLYCDFPSLPTMFLFLCIPFILTPFVKYNLGKLLCCLFIAYFLAEMFGGHSDPVNPAASLRFSMFLAFGVGYSLMTWRKEKPKIASKVSCCIFVGLTILYMLILAL